MKKILLTITGFVVTLLAVAQSPNLMNYQGVARNAVGNVLPSQPVGLRLSILSGSPTGSVVYQETRNVTTNAFGLFNVVVGSPGAITTTGTIAGINWTAFGVGSGTKFLQVEIDPIGGTNYFNVGSTQLVSVPYALNAGAAAPVGPAGGDLTGTYPNPQILFPLIKTFSFNASPLIGMTNSSATGTTGAIQGTSASTDANAVAIQGTMSSTTPGGFSAAVRGVNNGTGGLGIGVWGSQAGSGWGVYGTSPNGFAVNGLSTTSSGVNGSSTSGIGVAGTSASAAGVSGTSTSGAGVFGTSSTSIAGFFQNTNPANVQATLLGQTNGSGPAVQGNSSGSLHGGLFSVTNATGPGDGVVGNTTGLGRAGRFEILNAANTANAIEVNTIGLGRAGLFQNTNAANTASTIVGNSNGSGASVEGTNTGTGRGGNFVVNNPASTADGLRGETNGTGASWAIRGVSTGTNGAGLFQQTNATNTSNNLQSNQAGLGRAGLFNSTNAASTANAVDINVAGTGFALRAASSNATPKALLTVGGVQLTGIGEAANRFLMSDATGNATWSTLAGGGGVSGSGTLNFIPKWTPDGATIGNSQLFDNGSNVGLGTTAPTHRFTVSHGGATGIGVTSTSGFSVVDINAQNGDAALRYQNAGTTRWNVRNAPGTNDYQIVRNNSLPANVTINNGSGFVGIVQTAPAYQLDVLNAGGNGIRSQSSASFAVVDIDAANGDAALRFQSAGVGQWNMRNQPGTNNLEWFELGGGGTRLILQDATGNFGIGTAAPATKLHVGNVDDQNALRLGSRGDIFDWNFFMDIAGIGSLRLRDGNNNPRMTWVTGGGGQVGIGTESPSYKLDVSHGGATGIRSQSTSSFSVVDIDAINGDAALRFQKAGVGQWNIRNNPANDDLQFFELGGGGERMRIENTTGNVVVNGNLSKGGGSFKIDHPLDPANKYLYHSFVESPDMMNIYNGNIVTDANGKAIVKLPEYFEALNMQFRYQLTVIGSFAQAIINTEVKNNQFEIATNQPNVKVSWQVTGVRQDAFANQNRIPTEVEKAPQDKGKFLHPKAFNQPVTKSIGYDVTSQGTSLNETKAAPAKVANPLNTTGGSLKQSAIIAPSTKTADVSGSLINTPASKTDVKPVDNSGSVAPQPKKEEVKPVVKPTGVESTKG